MDQVRYGIIGLGNMGSGHVKRLINGEVSNAVLTAICDIKQDRIDAMLALCGDKPVASFLNYKDLLASGLVDAVMIATPHYLHPVIGIEAFEAGLHVLSEKPIGVYTKSIIPFMDAAKKSGKAFGIMYNQRTNPAFQEMRRIVTSGELGELKRSVWIITNWYRSQAYYNSGGWRATWAGEGGGVLLNQCPHNLDIWQWVVGLPKRMRGFTYEGKYHDIEVEDDVTAYAEYENGATGVFITSTADAPGTNRFEITGSRGKLVYDDQGLTFTRLAKDEREYCFSTPNGFGTPDSTTIKYQFNAKATAHTGIFQNFTNHILNGEPLLAPGYEGIRGLSISNAIMLSSWEDRWVDLPNDGEEFYAQLQKRIAGSKLKEDTNAGPASDFANSFGAK